MFVSHKKFVVEKNFPLGMIQFTIAEGDKCIMSTLPTSIRSGEILERIWKLEPKSQYGI
jgi:hypothetical protein